MREPLRCRLALADELGLVTEFGGQYDSLDEMESILRSLMDPNQA